MDADVLEFALNNCDVNMTQALGMLQLVYDGNIDLSREAGQQIVDLLENFRSLKKALEAAQ